MATKIEWCDETWNPITGCTKCSPACDHCYAEQMSKRLAGRYGYPADDPFRVTLHPDKLAQPLSWKKPKRIFVVSMGDLFHPSVPNGYIAAVFGVMAAAHWHTFMVLTKRIERAAQWFEWIDDIASRGFGTRAERLSVCRHHAERRGVPGLPLFAHHSGIDWPLPNVLIGATIWDQPSADRVVPTLLQIPAAIHFASIEPMLGAVDVREWLHCRACGYTRRDMAYNGDHYLCKNPSNVLRWIICGCETGPGARPMHPDLVRSLRDQCVEAGVPFFFKGWGEWFPWNQIHAIKRPRRDEIEKAMDLPSVYKKQTYFGYRVVNGPDGLITGTTMGVFPESIYPVGKKLAGRELDGRTWDQFPEV